MAIELRRTTVDPIQNPYRPGAGTIPLTLAGRQSELNKARILFARIKNGDPQQSLIFYGLRGVGKTVLLNNVEEHASSNGYLVDHIEISEGDDFRMTMLRSLRKMLLHVSAWEGIKEKVKTALGLLKAFSLTLPNGMEVGLDIDAIPGQTDTGNFQLDLTELMVELGTLARVAAQPVCFLLDEVQYINSKHFGALIAACHRVTQKALPVVVVCAGLPQIAALSGDAKSYAERLFEFIRIENLTGPNATDAVTGPAAQRGVIWDEQAIDEVLHFTEGYPYFIQEYGKHIWDVASHDSIHVADVELAKEGTIRSLDGSFFKVRIDRATEGERRVMRAMAELGAGPYRMSDVAKQMNRKMESLGPARASLISKGFAYSPDFGLIAFSVPQFDKFLGRYYNKAGKHEE
jgi:hypothetical protein